MYNPEVYNFKTLFGPNLNIWEADYNLLNKFVIHKFIQYQVINIKDYSLWKSIQIDFVKFEVKHFDKLDNAILKVFKDYYYLYKVWINFNLGHNKTYNITILKTVIAK